MCADTAPAPTPADAAALAARGLAVFPLPPGGRRPAAPGWQRQCLTDPAAVLRTWPAGANIGVGCRASRIVGLDLDGDGAASLADLVDAHGADRTAALDTLTVCTPSGGRHLYYRVPQRCTIASSSGTEAPLGPGIDVRGPGVRSGGYLIGPGSRVAGTAYAVTLDRPIRPLPGWLAQRLTGTRPGGPAPRRPGRAAEPRKG
ncbi:bifunctional DNA primase/polymerase [Kitasatospora sp. NPDC059646]|uniref:bifunctional DNA primase/polymerase n=1 Tax=Kitasatospora sp. NPDC059646 TaxID=3346893 RepID=UPI0036CDC2BD